MTSAPSAAVAKHVQLPQYRTTARTGQRVLQANTLLICRNGTSLRCVQHSNLSRVAAVLRAAACVRQRCSGAVLPQAACSDC